MSGLGNVTEAEWAQLFLAFNKFPITSPNLTAVVSWEIQESGDPANAGGNNPLNTTQGWPGATDFNSFGPNGEYHVKNYLTIEDGLSATSAGLHNGLYEPIIAALEAGDNAQAVIDAVMASPWGTKNIHLVEPPIEPAAPPSPPCDVECWKAIEQIALFKQETIADPLRAGQSSWRVTALKQWLARLGPEFDVGNDAPLYGELLVAAVKRWKQHVQLSNDDGTRFGGTAVRALLP